ncbi:hypothetical protein TRIATDRAFT_259435 [Trichoderma atroviride IMI 206040]|uniref:Uncharacterized protein n=1 Tax=Hypocrea atroviridis (strain ATCC 20476 / IMI 206040) TaxID=452589 RepID=G9P7Q0_HYPAI|nr:uncharacterized protein TRIATDRAFT_302105 [Trichoderma atroviride IMI 206040]EHK41641.1 hypothetical protein TRIATDRAFT_259435 [Trichoderma atroviride IMI 206040]
MVIRQKRGGISWKEKQVNHLEGDYSVQHSWRLGNIRYLLKDEARREGSVVQKMTTAAGKRHTNGPVLQLYP